MKYYEELGYKNIGVGDEISVEINNIKKGSHSIIKCKCDNCGKEKEIQYRVYLRYGNQFGNYLCRKCSQFKLEETNLKNHGKKYPSQREEILNKMKKSMMEIYGVENASQSNELQMKKIETNRKKFGCDWGLSNDDIKNKSVTTSLKKYGTKKPSQNKIIKNKILLKLNDVDLQKKKSKKIKDTCLKKYGVEHVSQIESTKEKTKQTFLKKYQVEHVLQNEEIYKKMIKNSFKIINYKNTPLYYQGTYEKDFLDKYFGNFTIMNGKTILYEMKNKKMKYYSDFYLPDFNMIVEIKSTIWYEKHFEKNLIKQKTCIEQGYNFIFIIDKNYDVFNETIKELKKGIN